MPNQLSVINLMGCDIHCYIEYKKPSHQPWRNFGGRINPGRNYILFGALAGVRCDDIPHITPRGIAPDMAGAAFSDCSIYVSKLETGWEEVGGDVHYSRSHAAECVGKGYCQWLPRSPSDNPPSFVTDSDYHTHSWLNADEFELAIASYLKAVGFQLSAPRLTGPKEASELNLENPAAGQSAQHHLTAITAYWPILHAMRCFEAQGMESRLVFWFDN